MSQPLQPIPRHALPAFPNSSAAAGNPAGGPSGFSFDFRRAWHTLRERWWVVAISLVTCLLLAVVYLVRTPKMYQTRLGLEVEFQDPTTVAGDETAARMRSAFLATQETLRTIEQNLTNITLLARVVRAEGFAQDGGKTLLGESIVKNDGDSPRATPTPRGSASGSESAPTVTFTPLEQALAGALSRQVKTVVRRGTRLIDVYVMNRDPVVAQRVAEAIGREYIRASAERRSVSGQETLRYLMEEEERLKGQLARSEAAVAEYKANTPDALQLGGGAAATGGQSVVGATRGGLVEDKLQELSTRLTTARAERMRIERELDQVEQAADNTEALLAIPSIAAAAPVNERRRELAQVDATVATLAQRYKEKHPKMMAARAALAEAQRSLQQTVLAQPAILRNMLEQARAAEKSAQAAFSEQEKAVLALNKAAIGYQQLARQAESDRAMYESILRQIRATDVSTSVRTTPVTIVERPIVPGRPISPRPTLALALSLFAGLLIGIGLIFGLDALDRSVKTVDEAEANLGLPALAAVPEFKTGDHRRTRKDEPEETGETTAYRLVAQAPEGMAAEAFRNLRASLALLGPETTRKVCLFTSAVPGEGKSFTSANYALSLAQQGYRVLLIDGDLRRPSLHKIFTEVSTRNRAVPQSHGVGIVDCLIGEVRVTDAVRYVASIDVAQPAASTGGQLAVLTGERRAPNPAELLGSGRFAELIAAAGETFDRIVVDSAPVLAVSDTLLMAPHVQVVCMVVRAGKTARHVVRRAIGLLSTAGRIPAGFVLNRLPRGRGGAYYYYTVPGYGESVYGNSYGAPSERSEAAVAR
jgi:polysaccharide biosynthesis transport protein